MKYILENVLYYLVNGIKFLLFEPFLLIKTYLAPDGCRFIAYDYKIEKKEVDGKEVVLFANDYSLPHPFYEEDEIILPVKNRLDEKGFPFVYTKYTDKNFFIDEKNNILYLKDFDLAFGNAIDSYPLVNKFIHRKRHNAYAAEALGYLNNRQGA